MWIKLGQKILNIQYEDLIENSVYNIKKMINFCDLDWDDNCLNHHKNNMPIKTLSLNQANKPIYKTSVNSSKNFEPYLNKIFSNFNWYKKKRPLKKGRFKIKKFI